MNKEESDKLVKELKDSGFSSGTVIEQGTEPDGYDVLVFGKDDTFVREKEESQCESKLKDLIFKLRTDGYDVVIFDPKKEIRISMEYEAIVRGTITCKECLYYVPKNGGYCVEGHLLNIGECEKLVLKESECEKCFQYIPDKHGGFCEKERTAPDEGENCPDFKMTNISAILAAEHKEVLNELHVRRIMLKSLKESLMNYHHNKMNTYQIIREFNQVLIDGIITDHPELKNNKHAHQI